MAKPKQHQSDYDSPWKEVIERFFPQFMAFFFPKAYDGIDWSKGDTFLDKEFQKATRDTETGKRYVDKLVQVYLQDDEETWVLVAGHARRSLCLTNVCVLLPQTNASEGLPAWEF